MTRESSPPDAVAASGRPLSCSSTSFAPVFEYRASFTATVNSEDAMASPLSSAVTASPKRRAASSRAAVSVAACAIISDSAALTCLANSSSASVDVSIDANRSFA